MHNPDTIVARATAPGAGGVAVVRVSGPNVVDIITAVTQRTLTPRHATLLTVTAADATEIDHGIGLFFPGPNSFTGEDVFEFHGHGGDVVSELVIRTILDAGARRAEPGEFSRRAFQNDKLDLAQAEAIADLIASGSEEAARAALQSLSGAFSAQVNALIEALTRVRIWVEAAIDFPDEEIDFLNDVGLQKKLSGLAATFDDMQEKVQSGRVLNNGFRVVLAGKPNAGKSSLMNALSGDDTAIVTEFAGTTRDVLRETIRIDGLSVELIDTAGLRDDPDQIEEEGIRRARRAMTTADAVLWLIDASDAAADAPESAEASLVVYNKSDLVPTEQHTDGVWVSAKTGAGLPGLRETLKTLAGYRQGGDGAFTARQRHVDALQTARSHFDAGRRALEQQHAGELLAEELRLAQDALSEITGKLSADDLLGRIFSDFCIGK